MTGVTQDRDQDSAGLSAADEQLLRELTKPARAGGVKRPARRPARAAHQDGHRGRFGRRDG